MKIFADYASVPEKLAIRIRDEFLPKGALSPDTISGIESLMQDAVAFKFIPAPLTKEQLSEVIQIPKP